MPIQEQHDPLTGELVLVGAHRTVRVSALEIAALGRLSAIRRAVLTARDREIAWRRLAHLFRKPSNAGW